MSDAGPAEMISDTVASHRDGAEHRVRVVVRLGFAQQQRASQSREIEKAPT